MGVLHFVASRCSGNTVRMIAIDEVCYFQAADKYTSVITADAEWLIRTSLRDLLGRLPVSRVFADLFRQM